MIAVENLSKRYGRQMAVDDITFRCEPGTVTGFLGPNGAGKSTTMRMICGLTPPSGGSAVVLGGPLPRAAEPRHARRRAARRLGPAQRPHRPRGALALRPRARRPALAGRRAARPRRPLEGGGAQARRQLLARHAPAARHRPRAARRPRGAGARRAGQRARPRGHRLDAPPAARLRRPRRHRAALLAPAARGRGDRRPDGRHPAPARSSPRAPRPSCWARPASSCGRSTRMRCARR